jgi:phosphonate transport system permease protein
MQAEGGTTPRGPRRPSGATTVAVIMLTAVAAAVWLLARSPGELRLTRGGARTAWAFASRAFTPALVYESRVPAGTPPLVVKALGAAKKTVTFAAAASSLAWVGGIVFGFLASSAWWSTDRASGGTRRLAAAAIYAASRFTMAVLRSIHELLWAVLLLAAFGLGELAAILAIAVPYSAILGKVWSEMVDEAPREPASALRDAGASPVQVFWFALVPQALPDILAYALYRFECALRSAAILGFFGFPTLGYYIAASFENLLYGEVWTYLYVLFSLILITDWWSGALRRRFVR